MTSRKSIAKVHSGSPTIGEPGYLLVGTLRRPHGLRGELLMDIVTDFPERLAPKGKVYLGEKHEPAIILGARAHGRGLLIRFRGINSPEAAGKYHNQPVFVTAADRPPLPPGQYYHHQLIGCNVVTEGDEYVGRLTEILQTGANDIYVVRSPAGREILLPVISSVVLQIDAAGKSIRVRLPEGLEDL